MQVSTKIIRFTEDGRSNVLIYRLELPVDDGVAFIEWDEDGRIYYVKVPEQSRRKGIATLLWDEANKYYKQHKSKSLSHSEYRSNDGDAWAKSFGTELPTRVPI